VDCSRTPARIRPATYASERASSTTDSTPPAASRCESSRPAGPAPMIATWVRRSPEPAAGRVVMGAVNRRTCRAATGGFR
jgi:hypothetical protein